MIRYATGLVDPKSLEPVRSTLRRFAPVRSGSLQFAPVRSSSLRFARNQHCPSRNQRNVKRQNDLQEETVSPIFISEIGY